MFRLLTLSFGLSHLTLVFLYSTHPRCVSSLCLCTSPLVSLYLSHTPTLSFLLSLSLREGCMGRGRPLCLSWILTMVRLHPLSHCMSAHGMCVPPAASPASLHGLISWLCNKNCGSVCLTVTSVVNELPLYCICTVFFAPPAGEKWFISPWMWFLFFSLHSLYNFCLMCGDFVASCH